MTPADPLTHQPLSHPVQILRLLAQLTLGGLFIAAAWPKLLDPPMFAAQVVNYKLLPSELVNFVAIFLPWLELFLGLSLITGLGYRGSNLVVGLLLVAFIVALSINLARGHAVSCGCFDINPEPKTDAELFADMKWTIARDVGMLFLVGLIAWASTKRPRAPGGDTQPVPAV